MALGKGWRGAVALAAAVLAVTGCGDDGGGGGDDAAKDIEAVAVKALTTPKPSVRCDEAVTRAFVRAVYGDTATCRKAETPESDDKPATGARVTDVVVDGDRGTANVTTLGGDADGARGEIAFAREDGAWKVDELSVAFLRSQLQQGFENDAPSQDDGPLADEEVRACVAKGLQALDDREFRELAYDAMSDREPAGAFVEVITRCTSRPTSEGDVSLLRRRFEEGIRESLVGEKATRAEIDCVLRDMRRTVSEDEIVAQVRAGADKPSGDLTAKAARAIAKCRGG